MLKLSPESTLPTLRYALLIHDGGSGLLLSMMTAYVKANISPGFSVTPAFLTAAEVVVPVLPTPENTLNVGVLVL